MQGGKWCLVWCSFFLTQVAPVKAGLIGQCGSLPYYHLLTLTARRASMFELFGPGCVCLEPELCFAELQWVQTSTCGDWGMCHPQPWLWLALALQPAQQLGFESKCRHSWLLQQSSKDNNWCSDNMPALLDGWQLLLLMRFVSSVKPFLRRALL